MSKVTEGLKKLAQRELLPDGEYRFRIRSVKPTKANDGEGANLVVVKGPDPELKGKTAYLYMRSYESEQAIGLSMLMKHFQLLAVPDGPYGEQDTRNFEGQEFDAVVVTKPDKNGENRNNVNPTFDDEWWGKVMSGEITDEDQKTTKKKASKRR